jgi:hypothetical protein
MLIATLVNLEGNRAVVEVDRWTSNVWPSSLSRNGRVYFLNTMEPYEAGPVCTGTYHEASPTRHIDITGLPLTALALTQEQQEEQAA